MTIFYILLALAIVSAVVFVVLSNGQTSFKPLIFKSIASFCFTILALYICYFNQNLILPVALFIVGLIASCFGDVILGLHGFEEFKEKRNGITLFGGLCFALAHVAYFVAMVVTYGWAWWMLLIALALAVVFYLSNVLIFKVDYGTMKFGIMIYGMFVSTVTAQGVYALFALGFSWASVIIALGFLFFYASDVVLMNIFFGNHSKQENRKLYYFNLAFYYAAQILIATFLMFI